MTLLETVLAMSLMSIISLAAVLGVRISWQAWSVQDQRSDTFGHLNGLLTHVTRHLRSTRSVVAVSAATDTSGYITITLPDDSVVKWDHDGATSQVLYGVDPPTDLLATGIGSLKFECFEIDGVTATTVPADIRMIRTTASVTIPVQGTSFPLSSTVWIRKQQDALAAEYIDFYASTSSTPIGWQDHGYSTGPPDGLLSSGPQGARIRTFGFDSTGYTGPVGTVLVGLYLKTDGPVGDDDLKVQLERTTTGPAHFFGEPHLLRFENNLDWFWVDVTDDYATWTYEDLVQVDVDIENQDGGAGGATIYLDSVKIRTFETAPLTQTFWLASAGTWNREWRDRPNALGAPDGLYARSRLTFWQDVDRQAYFHSGSWEDLGSIIGVNIVVTNFYITLAFTDDQFHARFPSPSEAQEPNDTPVPNTAKEVPLAELNAHVGIANLGTVSMDFTNLESSWTWPELNSRYVRLYGTAVGDPDGGNIKVDAVGVEVHYVPPTEAAVVLWEEL